MKKRIGILMYQTSTSKGQELIAQRMVRDFIALGHEAYLITSVYHDGVEVIPPESLRQSKGYVFVEDSELGIPVIRVDSYVVKWPRRRISFRDFVQVLEKIVDEFKLNVLITHSTLWNGPEEVAKFVSWRRYMRDLGGYKDPIVFCHMSHFQEPSKKLYSRFELTFRMAWNKFSLSQILKTANLVIVVTPLEKQSKVKLGADPKKCFLYPGGVNEELFLRFAATDVKDFLKRHGISEDVKLVSYMGTLEERKNPAGVLKVAELLKDRHDIHFLIAGRDGTRYADRIKSGASRMSNVTFLGEVDDKEKILLMKSSFVNILLSRLEALGLTQLEFMYAGVPVVTSGVGGQSWIIRDGREGICTAGSDDVNGAAKAIVNLANDSEMWSKLSINAKEKAKNFITSKIIRELDEAITEEMIEESGLKQIPTEALRTLAEPEHVLKTWSAGSWRAVATNKRLYVKKGHFSRKVAEIPYTSIAYIEHTRRYPWNVLFAGLLPSLVVLLGLASERMRPGFWSSIFNYGNFIKPIEEQLNLAAELCARIIPQITVEVIPLLFALVPGLMALGVFVLQARTGFNLYGFGAKPIYVPHKLSGVVAFIRSVQDKLRNTDLYADSLEATT